MRRRHCSYAEDGSGGSVSGASVCAGVGLDRGVCVGMLLALKMDTGVAGESKAANSASTSVVQADVEDIGDTGESAVSRTANDVDETELEFEVSFVDFLFRGV